MWTNQQHQMITLRMHTASITSLTPAGGFVIVLTIAISFCFSVSRAVIAAFIAGIATANFSSHSSCSTSRTLRLNQMNFMLWYWSDSVNNIIQSLVIRYRPNIQLTLLFTVFNTLNRKIYHTWNMVLRSTGVARVSTLNKISCLTLSVLECRKRCYIYF